MPDRPKHMPAGTPDHLAPAWRIGRLCAIDDPDVFAIFVHETGIDVTAVPGVAVSEAFASWFNERIWGPVMEAVDDEGEKPSDG